MGLSFVVRRSLASQHTPFVTPPLWVVQEDAFGLRLRPFWCRCLCLSMIFLMGQPITRSDSPMGGYSDPKIQHTLTRTLWEAHDFPDSKGILYVSLSLSLSSFSFILRVNHDHLARCVGALILVVFSSLAINGYYYPKVWWCDYLSHKKNVMGSLDLFIYMASLIPLSLQKA